MQAVQPEVRQANLEVFPFGLDQHSPTAWIPVQEPHRVEAPVRPEFDHHPIRSHVAESLSEDPLFLRLMPAAVLGEQPGDVPAVVAATPDLQPVVHDLHAVRADARVRHSRDVMVVGASHRIATPSVHCRLTSSRFVFQIVWLRANRSGR